jgi:hypothetical protein
MKTACLSRLLHQTAPPRPAACHHHVTGRPVLSHSVAITPPSRIPTATSRDGSMAGYPPPTPLPKLQELGVRPGYRLPAAIKGPRHVPTSPRTAAATPSSSIGTRAPPPQAPPPPVHRRLRTHLYTPFQPKVGRGIKYLWSPLRFALLLDRRRGSARRGLAPAGRTRATTLPLSLLNRGGGERWQFSQRPLGLFPFPHHPSLFPSLFLPNKTLTFKLFLQNNPALHK